MDDEEEEEDEKDQVLKSIFMRQTKILSTIGATFQNQLGDQKQLIKSQNASHKY